MTKYMYNIYILYNRNYSQMERVIYKLIIMSFFKFIKEIFLFYKKFNNETYKNES